jgi:hypothetical protein
LSRFASDHNINKGGEDGHMAFIMDISASAVHARPATLFGVSIRDS